MRLSPRARPLLRIALVCTALPLAACIGEKIVDTSAFNGPPFSAEIFDPTKPAKPVSRIWFSNGRIRLTSLDTSSIGTLVVDPAHSTTLIINDPAKAYIDAGMFTPLVAIVFGPVMAVLRPSGTGDPCAQWTAAANPFGAYMKQSQRDSAPKFTCTAAGTESVNGRAAHKWTVTSNDPTDGTSTIWVDDRLHLLSRMADKDGTTEMRNVVEGPQADSLFTPPASYRRLSVASIIGGVLGGKSDSSGASASAGGFLKKLQSGTTH